MSETFTLETLRARHGDCLILHWGDAGSPRRMLIDGGAARVYDEVLLPRLEELRGDDELLRFRMLLVSHIDDDHVNGLLDLMKDLRRAQERDDPIRFRFQTLWHNAFDDILGNEEKAQALVEETSKSVGGAAALDAERLPPDLPVQHHSGLVLASVRQGRQLRLDAEALGIAVNQTASGEGGLLTAGVAEDLGGGLAVRLLGPSQEQVEELQEEWDDYLREKGLGRQLDEAEVAAFADESVFNLASLVMLAEKGGRTMLLTGDARGDHILDALEAAGLFDEEDFGPAGHVHVDLLKLPHHGSDRNVEPVFFERLSADHYVVSGDGRHGNPEPLTYRMLFDARRPEQGPFHLYLTYGLDEHIHHYPADEVREIFRTARDRGLEFDVTTPQNGSLEIPLLA